MDKINSKDLKQILTVLNNRQGGNDWYTRAGNGRIGICSRIGETSGEKCHYSAKSKGDAYTFINGVLIGIELANKTA